MVGTFFGNNHPNMCSPLPFSFWMSSFGNNYSRICFPLPFYSRLFIFIICQSLSTLFVRILGCIGNQALHYLSEILDTQHKLCWIHGHLPVDTALNMFDWILTHLQMVRALFEIRHRRICLLIPSLTRYWLRKQKLWNQLFGSFVSQSQKRFLDFILEGFTTHFHPITVVCCCCRGYCCCRGCYCCHDYCCCRVCYCCHGYCCCRGCCCGPHCCSIRIHHKD